jgi:RHS repeat-associated protein
VIIILVTLWAPLVFASTKQHGQWTGQVPYPYAPACVQAAHPECVGKVFPYVTGQNGTPCGEFTEGCYGNGNGYSIKNGPGTAGCCVMPGFHCNYPQFASEYYFYGYTWCPTTYNPATFDLDGDGIFDANDPYPEDATNQVAKGVEKDKTAYDDQTCDTQGCPCPPGNDSQPCSGGTGMPGLVVNLSSLNFVLQDKDIAYADIGRTIEIERSYNAYSTYQGIFGRGWTFNYGVYLVADASGNVTVNRGSGAEKLFTRQANGTYTPPKGVFDKLVKNADGTFSLWVKDEKLTYAFGDYCPFVSYWELNEGSGTTAGDSVGAHNGTIHGAAWTAGTVGEALSFDGVDDYVKAVNSENLNFANIITVEAWARLDATDFTKWYTVVCNFESSGWGIEISPDYDKWEWLLHINGSYRTVRSDAVVIPGEWYHIVGIYDGSEVSLFINGVKQTATISVTGSIKESPVAVTIGANPEAGGSFIRNFKGVIDEVAVYNTALSPEEIQQHYQNGLAGHGYLGEGSGYACNGPAGGHALTSVTDTNGNAVTLTYDSSGRLTTITDASGRNTTFTYNSDNQVSTITDPIGRPILFTYENGNMKTSTDLAGVTTTFTYDPANNYLLSMSTPLGATSFTYQDYPFGRRLASVTNPAGLTTLYAIDAPNSEVQVTDPLGHTTHYGYNYDGYTTYITDSLGNRTSYGYDAAGNRTSITDANNKKTTIAYDSRGNILSITDPLNKITSFTYDTRDNLTQTKDPLNRIYGYTYDAHDNLTKITDPLTHQTNFFYDAKGELTSLTDARGKTSTFVYDQYGNLQSITDPLNHTASFTYNLIGKQQTATDPLGHTSNFEYDPLGRLVRRIHADSAQFIIERYCSGIAGIIDENGKHTTYDHNAINMLTKVHDPMGYQTNYGYDNAGNLTTLTDPLSQATSYTYDVADRLTQMSYPEGAAESYSYDPAGNLISKTDANGVTTAYAYDELNRLLSLTAPDLAIGYAYDAVGNMLTMTDATGTTSYVYDSLNRLTQITYPTGLTVGYTYNEVGRITAIATPYAGVGYGYDDANRLTAITLPNNQQVIYQYDAAGNLLQVVYPNGTAAAYAYDTRNRLTAMTNFAPSNTVISTYAYTLDGVGNRTRVDLNEPMTPSYNAETINYTYSLGNILNTADGATYTHDANGNRISKTNTTNVTNYTYDSLNRLTQTSTSSRQIQYIYNGLGQRIGKIDNGVQSNYLIDPNGILPQVLAETDSNNNLMAFYVYDGVGLVAKITSSNQYYFYHYDGLGSTIAITDNTGQVVNTYCYSPEGLVGVQETIPNPFTYVGRYGVMAEGNGLYCMRGRYYDPEVGRFINKDPIGYAGGLNLYEYVENRMINGIDPWGLSMILIDINRTTVTNRSTIGTLTINYRGIGYTLELPDKGNQKFISRIPEGTYFGELYNSPSLGYLTVRLRGVPGNREYILIHVGNYPEDTEGCILPGKTKAKDFVGNSRKALNEILKIIDYASTIDKAMGEPTDLVIHIH